MGILKRQQRWAQDAFNLVSKVDETERKKYRSIARDFPALVHECGLVQAVAFLQVSGKSERYTLLKHLQEILNPQQPLNPQQLVDNSQTKDLLSYLHLSRQVLAVSGWLKRYAEALILAEEETENAN